MPPSLDDLVLAVGFDHQQRERNHFERGEDAAERHPGFGCADPVVVMAGADDAAAEQDDELEVQSRAASNAR